MRSLEKVHFLIRLIIAVCLFCSGALSCWIVFSNRCDAVRIKGLSLMSRPHEEIRRTGGILVRVADTIQYNDPSYTRLPEEE